MGYPPTDCVFDIAKFLLPDLHLQEQALKPSPQMRKMNRGNTLVSIWDVVDLDIESKMHNIGRVFVAQNAMNLIISDPHLLLENSIGGEMSLASSRSSHCQSQYRCRGQSLA